MRSYLLPASILGLLIGLGTAMGGYFLSQGIVEQKKLERSVTVKGLSEREVLADQAIWPIRFILTGNDLAKLHDALEADKRQVIAFLLKNGFTQSELSVSAPSITDKMAQNYGSNHIQLRYNAALTVTVYTQKIDRVIKARPRLSELAKHGIAVDTQDYRAKTLFNFTGLNELKPAMIEEATRHARSVAQKFAQDSHSRLGKIKRASQGQFSIQNRDANTHHIKKVRVVSTLVYYLTD